MKILHISIPKNGGTYIANNLATNFLPDEQYIVDENRVHLSDFLNKRDEVMHSCMFFAGHVPFRFVSAFADNFDLIVSSYRDPWSRTWSFFRFVTANNAEWAHLNPRSTEDAIEKFSTFIDQYFINNRFSRNSQCGYLGEANLPASALSNINTFNIQMLSSRFLAQNMQTLASKYKLTLKAGAPQNETPSDGIRIRPGEYPAIDQKIYQWFDGDFELVKQLDERRTL